MDSLLIPEECAKDAKPWNPRAFVARAHCKEGSASRYLGDSNGTADASAEKSLKALALLRATAHQEGFAAGLAAGNAESRMEAERVAMVVTSVSEAMANLETTIASTLLELAIELARAVVRSELNSRHDLVLPVLTEALRALPEAVTTGEIMLNPTDHDLVEKHLRESEIPKNWRLIIDPAIEPGGCRVITRSCDIDATLKTRWSRALQTIGRTDTWHSNASDE